MLQSVVGLEAYVDLVDAAVKNRVELAWLYMDKGSTPKQIDFRPLQLSLTNFPHVYEGQLECERKTRPNASSVVIFDEIGEKWVAICSSARFGGLVQK